jgi:glycosyltransferase involved in cell wall biosynthesis
LPARESSFPAVPDRPKISVVIPTFNRLHTLPRAVDSVLGQSEQSFELLIVDDASTDGTDRYLAAIGDRRVRRIGVHCAGAAAQRLGVSGARNLGLREARADIVAFLDSDDYYRRDYLAVVTNIFAREPDVVCTLTTSLNHMKGESHETPMPDVKLAPAAFEWALMCELLLVAASAIAVRRADALAIGGFNTDLTAWEDREFLIRLASRGNARLIPDVLWDKYLSAVDGLSSQRANYGPWLIDYVGACPAFRRYPTLVSYLATRVLIADVRLGLWSALQRDFRNFRAAELLAGGPLRLWRNYRQVKRYRRQYARQEALASLADPPHTW